MQIVIDNLHEMSMPVFWKKKNKKNILECCLLKFLPSMLSFKVFIIVINRDLSDFVISNWCTGEH